MPLGTRVQYRRRLGEALGQAFVKKRSVRGKPNAEMFPISKPRSKRHHWLAWLTNATKKMRSSTQRQEKIGYPSVA